MSHHSGSKKSVSTEIIALRKQVADLKESALERRRVEDALREAELLHRATLDEAPVPILRVGPGGQVLYANPAFLQLLGYQSRHEFKTVGELRGVFVDLDVVGKLMGGEQERVREVLIECHRCDGKPETLRLRVGPVGEEGMTLVYAG